MIVVAIIVLLAALALPNFLRARKRSQATRVLEDLRLLDGALDSYVIETSRPAGYVVDFQDLRNYIKTGTVLYSGSGYDLFGNSYGPFTADSIPKVNPATLDLLGDVVDTSFWSPYN
jgi:type II secretory pathway pseudopilin PulG